MVKRFHKYFPHTPYPNVSMWVSYAHLLLFNAAFLSHFFCCDSSLLSFNFLLTSSSTMSEPAVIDFLLVLLGDLIYTTLQVDIGACSCLLSSPRIALGHRSPSRIRSHFRGDSEMWAAT